MKSIKTSYKQKLFFYFFIIFALFTAGVIIFEQSRERSYKTEALEEKLDAYANIADVAIKNGNNQQQTIDSLLTLFPSNIRLSLIDRKGVVVFDNVVSNLSVLGNHSDRPEVSSALKNGAGSNVRKSASNEQEYLYYAKRFNSYFVRVALPYDISVQNFLKADNFFLYFIIGLFIICLLLISYVAGRFSKSIEQLRDFTVSAEKGLVNSMIIGFPDDELGEIGNKIAESYKELEQQKRKVTLEREKLLQHVHSSDEGLCFFSSDRDVEFYNGLFIQYLNTIIDNAHGNPELIFSNPLFTELNSFLSSSEKYFETQINKQGKTFAIRANIFEDSGFEVVINDITTQEKTRLLKQEMTGNIAHELRTPVTSIRGYLETVLEQKLDSDKEREFLTKAYNQVVVLSDLIQDIGLITKIEELPQSFKVEKININNLLSNLKADLEIPLTDRVISIEWNIVDSITVNGNVNLIYSVFRNLTDNVIRYAGNNVKITVAIYNEDKDFYYFSFADNGIGIADESHLNRLFERFYRINEGRTRDSGGSGLGLSIVKNAVLFHRGTITVKNRQDGGLEFLFKLPK
ncbi:MAG: HAMP domain-containing histidine kinase [Prevotellaceae bacterium]|jgi:signal transduction histidine kinase|nr:HAMP domain-containing histidine kinase [Prevotellaceae bacterium]